MELIFENGETMKLEFGKKLCGLKRGGHRPISVQLDVHDLQRISIDPMCAEYLVKHVIYVLKLK